MKFANENTRISFKETGQGLGVWEHIENSQIQATTEISPVIKLRISIKKTSSSGDKGMRLDFS